MIKSIIIVCILGMTVGAFSMIVSIYLSEIATKEHRGRIVSFLQLGITIGIGVSFWIDYMVNVDKSKYDIRLVYVVGMNIHHPESEWSWRIPFALQTVLAFIFGVGILFCFVPFSHVG